MTFEISTAAGRKKKKKIKLHTVYYMVSFNTLETPDNGAIIQSFEGTVRPKRCRGSRGVKPKGSGRWKGREKVVINEEALDVGGGGPNQRVLGGDSEL